MLFAPLRAQRGHSLWLVCFLGSIFVPCRVAVADEDRPGAPARAPAAAKTTTHAEAPTQPLSSELAVVEVTSDGQRPHPGAPPRARGVAGSVIAGERLVQPGSTTAHVLREVPGVQVTEVGGLGAPATASIRGATAAQTPVYLAGIRINDEVGGAANLADVPLFLIDHAVVYRSHAPLFADRLGVGGAIFFEPKSATNNELVSGAELGSYGTAGGWVYGAMARERRGLLAGFKLATADNDYPFFDDRGTLFVADDNNTRRLQNADARVANVWVHGTQALGRAQLSLLAHHSDRAQGAPKLALVPSREARVNHRRDLFALRSTLPVKAWDGELTLSSQAVLAETAVLDPTSELGLLTSETRTPGVRLEQGAEASQQIGERLSLVEKVSVAMDRLERFERRGGVLEPALTARRVTSRLAAAAEFMLVENVYADGTAAVSCVSTSLDTLTACNELQPNGRLGMSFRSDFFDVYGSVGRYHRDATLGELYGASLLVRGNPQLRPELGTTVEVGTRAQWADSGQAPVLWADLSAFQRSSEELVTYVRTAQGYLFPVNRKRAQALGAELAVGVAPLPWLEGTSQLSVLDARDTSPDRETVNDVLPFASRLLSATLLTLRAPLNKAQLDDAGVTGKWLYQSNRYADPAGLAVIPDQTSLDLEVWLRAFQRRVVTRARIANLLAERRFDVVGFPLPSRSAFLSIEATW